MRGQRKHPGHGREEKEGIALHTPTAPRTEQMDTPPLLLVGNPNVGKSVIFGALTGRYVNVSNYPGTTIEVTRGRLARADARVEVVDTPGTNHLIPMSEDERVTRDILIEEPDATVVQVGDAKNLRRVLTLTLELSLLGRPLILALNMMDEVRSLGIRIDRARLEKMLGVPVIETVAIRRSGLKKLYELSSQAHRPSLRAEYPRVVEEAICKITAVLEASGITDAARFTAVLLLSGDRTILPWLRSRIDTTALAACDRIRVDASRTMAESPSTIIQNCHLHAVDKLIEACYLPATSGREGWRHSFARWSIHPVKGIAVLALVLVATFWFVGLLGAGTLVDLMETGLFGQVLNPAAIRGIDAILPFPHEHPPASVEVNLQIPLTPTHGIDTGLDWSRRVVTPQYEITAKLSGGQEVMRLVHDLLVGPYGIFTMALAYGFAIVLPIVATFFLLFSLLEDSGYLPRLAVMVNDVFRAMGLNGRAVLPMVLGLGCDTMATLTTRILDTRKQRLIVTLLLALGVPCSAQLGVILAMMSAISPLGTVIWLFIIVAVMIGVGWLAARVFRGRSSDFLLELPPIRRPVVSNIVVKTVARLEWYLKEVLPLFILGTLILFTLDRTGVLPHVRDFAAPIVKGWLGLPPQTADAFLIGFLRRDYGAVFLLQAATGAHPMMNGNQILVSMTVITLFVPCIANVFIIAKEHGARIALGMAAFIFPFAFFVGGVLWRALRLFGVEV
jgi:ferrous iron transport protein B